MNIKQLNKEDGAQFLKLMLQLDYETSFMLYEPDERKSTVTEMEKKIEAINNCGIIFGIEEDKKLVGYVCAQRGQLNRIKHSAYIVIGVLQAYSGKGYGKALLKAVDEWAKNNNVRKLELTVMVHNERAYNLYKNVGYVNEGIKKKSILIDGELIDEYYMGKITD